MTHRGGLPLSLLETVEDMTRYETLIDMANAVGARGPEFPPDSKFWYSDAGSDALAAIVEVVTGMTIDAFWRAELFGPLGLEDTFVALNTDDPRYARIASLHVGSPNMWGRFWSPAQGSFYPYAWGSQSVYSTPLDYAKFLALWMDDGRAGEGDAILSPEAVERTLTPTSPMGMLGSDERYPTDFDGLELWYGRMSMLYMPTEDPENAAPVIIGHGGSDGTIAWAWPERDLMILYFTQSRGGTSALRLEKEIDRLLIHPGREALVEEVPDAYRPYVGVYVANFAAFQNEEFTVLVKDGKLALDIPSQLVFELLEPDEEGRRRFALAPEQVSVSFEREEDAPAHLLKLHQAGAIFEIPRKGTALAREMAERLLVDPELVQPLLGAYHDPEAGADLEVYLEGRSLRIKAPPGIVFHLVPTQDPRRFSVKQLPAAELSFEFDENGEVVSMTRHLAGATLVMPRVRE